MGDFKIFHKIIMHDFPEAVKTLSKNISEWDIKDPDSATKIIMKNEIKKFVKEFNLYGKQIEFYWSASDQKFIGTIN